MTDPTAQVKTITAATPDISDGWFLFGIGPGTRSSKRACVQLARWMAGNEANVTELEPGVVKKRSDYLTWNEYFMAVALLSAQRSKDPNSQVR